MQNSYNKTDKTIYKKPAAFKVLLLEQESIRTLYRNRLKGKLTQLTGEIDTDWLEIKEAITKQQKRTKGIRSGRTGNGFERGMTKYNWQQKKRKLITESIYKTKQWTIYRIQKTPSNSKENDTKAKKR